MVLHQPSELLWDVFSQEGELCSEEYIGLDGMYMLYVYYNVYIRLDGMYSKLLYMD